MCTCIAMKNGDFYFGRNLDLEYTFGSTVAVTPDRYPFSFRMGENMHEHYSMIGMAETADGYPLYAEAVNERGLGMAGLYFPGNAYYLPVGKSRGKKHCLAPFELIPWLLGKAATAAEAAGLLADVELSDIPFSVQLPNTPLHWMLADKEKCLTVEPAEDGLHIYENPFGVLTNNPPFPFHVMNTVQYLRMTSACPSNDLSPRLDLQPFGAGMGAFGLPGDSSPASRFVRAVFLKENSACPSDEQPNVMQFFHILEQVGMVRGTVKNREGKDEFTTYSCCINASRGIYYCRTYEDGRIRKVEMQAENADREKLRCYKVRQR